MACVVRYNFLLISIFLRSISWADTMVQVTPSVGDVGNEVIIQCATDNNNQDGVYMYKKEVASKNKQDVFYYYKDGTFTPKSTVYKAKVGVAGAFPNLKVTFSNVNSSDIGLYWCEFNLADKLTVGTVTWLWIKSVEKKQEKTEEGEAKEKDIKECPEEIQPRVKIFLTVCAVMSLLCIIGFIFVILKVKGYCGNKKYRPPHPPLDSVYEEMKRSNLDAQPSMRTFINPDYQSTKLLR